MSETSTSVPQDRVATRILELDLSLAGKVTPPKRRPAKRHRQQVAHFLGREGAVERFAIRQTIPYPGYEAEAPPNQAQYGAVLDFFLEPAETRYQANLLLSARDFAGEVAQRWSYNAYRRRLIWICSAAYILSDTKLRSRVRTWNIARRSPRSRADAYGAQFRLVSKFADRLVADMQAAGAKIFG